MKKAILLGLLSFPFLVFSQEFIKYGFVEGILPVGNTSDFREGGFGLTGELGINVLNSLDLTLYTGAQILFFENYVYSLESILDGGKEKKTKHQYLVPVMAKAKYYLTPVGIKPYISLAGGIVNTFDDTNEDTFYAIKPSVGVKFSKLLIDLSYLRSEKQVNSNFETISLSVGYKL